MATEQLALLSGFAWAVPAAFSDAVGACQFSRGDTLYSSPIAYREWNEEFYKSAKGLYAIKVLSPESKPTPPSPALFQGNWSSVAEVEVFMPGGQEGVKRLSTTQGRIYSLLWRGDSSVLDPAMSVPLVPHHAGHLLKNLNHAKSTLRQLILDQHPDARYFFVLPHDVCSQLLDEKYRKLAYGLGRTCHASEVNIDASVLPIPEADRLAPTVSLKTFIFTGNEEQLIQESLKELLYVRAVNTKSKKDMFRLNAHGFFSKING
jgi:hypothetical protein